MIPLVLVGFLGLGATLVLLTRFGHQGERTASTDLAAHAGAMILFAGLGFSVVWYGFIPLARAAAASPASIGALVGLFLLVVVEGGRRLAGLVFLWSTRRPVEFDRAGFELRNAAVSAIGYSAVGAGVGWVTAVLPRPLHILLLPAFVAALPFFQAVVRPWIMLARAPTLSDAEGHSGLSDVTAWFEQLTSSSGVASVRLRLQPGNMRNAYVVGGFWGHWVVVGEGLLGELSERELKAILAHEVAHVIRNDVRRYLFAAGAAGTVYALGLPGVFRLWQDGQVMLGIALAAMLGSICFGVIPGWVSRRAEFAADRLSVRLVGNPLDLASGPERLAKLKGFTTDRESLTHPSVDRRIKALEAAKA